MSRWAIDLGTSNSAIARWNEEGQYPEMIHLEEVCRQPHPEQTLDVRYSVPSSLFILPGTGLKHQLASWPFVQRRFFWGQQALIGRAAQERDANLRVPNFIGSFKPYLMRDGYRTVTRVGNQSYSARQVATLYLRELLSYVKQKTGERPRHLVFGTPVDSYEPYRAQLKSIASAVGIRKFQTVDEPIAAAVGYGLRIDEPQLVLVIDFGGGTLDLALIRLDEKKVESGRCEVIAKDGVPIGGNLVDAWLVEEFCHRLGYELALDAEDPAVVWWYRIMAEEACRVKESLFFRPKEAFFMTPPREMQRLQAQLQSRGSRLEKPLEYTREELIDLLRRKGLYDAVEQSLDRVMIQARGKGFREHEIREVLMVGGSTLLPNIYPLAEQRFGRDKIRAWQPFDAVAFGACAFSAGQFVKADFITHDYAFVTYKRDSHDPEYHVIIPAGTAFPTTRDFWKRHLTPTCPLGEPERIFKLSICELGHRHSIGQEFVWDREGQVHALGEKDDRKPLVIPLNESNPTLGTLDPPHSPSDRSARLEISFGVNEERWLCATVLDLKTRKVLLTDAPVVRLK